MAVCTDPATGATLGVEKTQLAIYQELSALSGSDKAAVWALFTSGSPPLWSKVGEPGVTHDKHGPVISIVAGLAIDMAVSAGFTAADQTRARLRMVAVYLLDAPRFLADSALSVAVKAIVPYIANP